MNVRHIARAQFIAVATVPGVPIETSVHAHHPDAMTVVSSAERGTRARLVSTKS